MNELSVEDIRILKKKYGLSNAQLSEESGVPLGTVNKVLSKATKNPRSNTLSELARPLRQREIQNRQDLSPAPFNHNNYQTSYEQIPSDLMVSEKTAAYDISANSISSEKTAAYDISDNKTAGSFTLNDYYLLPDDHRVELIDGCFYDMAAPTTTHQRIALSFAFAVTSFIKSHKGSCHPFISPLDVRPDPSDNKTIVQPDFLIVCDPAKIKEKYILGAPDFILEIISPSTSSRDYYKKSAKYQESGVREYWIIDPIQKRLTVFYFETGQPIHFSPLQGKAGIGIYQNELEIDLDEIAALCN